MRKSMFFDELKIEIVGIYYCGYTYEACGIEPTFLTIKKC